MLKSAEKNSTDFFVLCGFCSALSETALFCRYVGYADSIYLPYGKFDIIANGDFDMI